MSLRSLNYTSPIQNVYRIDLKQPLEKSVRTRSPKYGRKCFDFIHKPIWVAKAQSLPAVESDVQCAALSVTGNVEIAAHVQGEVGADEESLEDAVTVSNAEKTFIAQRKC